MTATVPADLLDLLDRPLYGALATIRPDGSAQVNPMWFEYDGAAVRFTHTNYRAKFRNLQANPAMTLLVIDPDDPLRYIELRGRLREVIADPQGQFYVRLARRYGSDDQAPPPDSPQRVILVMAIEQVTRH